MRDLEDGPEDFVPLFAVVGGALGVFHLVRVGEERVFYVIEAGGRGLAVATVTDGGHGGMMGGGSSLPRELLGWVKG